LPHYEYRTLGGSYHLLGYTANHAQRFAGPTVGSHHDEIGLHLCRITYDPGRWTGRDQRNRVCIRMAVFIGEKLVQPIACVFFALPSQVRKTGNGSLRARRKSESVLQNMQDVQSRAKGARKLACMSERVIRRRFEINRNENIPQQ